MRMRDSEMWFKIASGQSETIISLGIIRESAPLPLSWRSDIGERLPLVF